MASPTRPDRAEPFPEPSPEPSPERWSGVLLPVALAMVAGFVDAVGFIHLFGVFPANQSGNAILLGISIGQPSVSSGADTSVAIVGFLIGTASALVLARRLPPHRRPATLLATELVLLVALGLIVSAIDPEAGMLAEPTRAALLLLAATAMGIQTEVIRRAAGVTVATTYQTGAIARIGETAGTVPGSEERARARRQMSVLGIVLAGYVGGAALGATGLGNGRIGLVIPCVVLALLLAATVAAPALLVPAVVHDGRGPDNPSRSDDPSGHGSGRGDGTETEPKEQS